MIEANQKMMINEQHVNPAINEHFKLQIKTLLENAPRDPDKLERLLKIKQRQKGHLLDRPCTARRSVLQSLSVD